MIGFKMKQKMAFVFVHTAALFSASAFTLPPYSCNDTNQFLSIMQMCGSAHEPGFGACLMLSPNETVGKVCACAKHRSDTYAERWTNCMGPCWQKLDTVCAAPLLSDEGGPNLLDKLNLRVCPPGTEYQFVHNSHVCGVVAPAPKKCAKDGTASSAGCPAPHPTLLVAAVLENDLDEVVHLLKTEKEHKAGAVTEGNDYEHALMVAAELGFFEIVRTLLGNKRLHSLINVVNPRLMFEPRKGASFMPTPLTYAVAGWYTVIKGYPVNHTVADPHYPELDKDGLQTGWLERYPQNAQNLGGVAAEQAPSAATLRGARVAPAHSKGAAVDHAKVVEILMDAGATPFAGITGASPIGFALEIGLLAAARLMLGKADCGELAIATNAHNEVDGRTGQNGVMPHVNLVHAAAGTFTREHMVGKTMFRARHLFDPVYEHWGKQLDTVFAAFTRCNISTKTRVDEVNPRDFNSYTPFANAVMRCDGKVSRVLLDAGVDPFGDGVFGTLLHSAALVGCGPVVHQLLQQAYTMGGTKQMLQLVVQKDFMFERAPLQITRDKTVACYLTKAMFGIPPEQANCEGAQDMLGVLQNLGRGNRNLQPDARPHADVLGAWRKFDGLPPMASDSSPKCEMIEIDSTVDSAEFFTKYHSLHVPIILRNATPWNVSQWTPQYLKQHAGDEAITTTHIPYKDTADGQKVTLGQFVDDVLSSPRPVNGKQPPQYLFDNAILKRNAVLKGNVALPQVFAAYMKEQTRQLIIGSEGSGSPVHTHVGAVNLALFGRKLWYVYPHGGAFYKRAPFMARETPILNWYLNDGPKLDGDHLECIQNPGDMVFVPNNMGHGVLNLEDTIAVAMEVQQTKDPRPSKEAKT